MHELSITQEVVKIVQDAFAGAGGEGRVSRVILRIGKYSAVVPKYIEHYYHILTENTPLNGAEIVVKDIPVVAGCEDCGEEFKVEEANFVCPDCGGKNTILISGRELFVESIEVNDEEDESTETNE